jgi:hypothetical protein
LGGGHASDGWEKREWGVRVFPPRSSQVGVPQRIAVPVLFFVLVAFQWAAGSAFVAAENRCLECHAARVEDFAAGHAFAAERCTLCHGGDAESGDRAGAHGGLIGFPGNLSNANRTCGRCHPEQVRSVRAGAMRSGTGIVQVTRSVLGQDPSGRLPADLSHLGDSPADSLLRKLCAGCHLGHDKTRHAHDVVGDRGGGCLACHINEYPRERHPMLTRRVSDGRCFGCHSRSGRISLSYPGIAETDAASAASLARLGDGRLVERKAADVHHRAAMACIDCHTGSGLMGAGVDISCRDCHANEGPRLRVSEQAGRYMGEISRLPYPVTQGQEFLTTARRQTPLWHIEVRDGRYRLHRRLAAGVLEIPQYGRSSHPLEVEHARLTCDACHSQWAPQCYGCHMSYSPDGEQWDHLLRRRTPGRWEERRWDVVNGPPPLGVTVDGAIAPFIPGMILRVEHPSWDKPLFRRLFARVSPHTIGAARSCTSCHHSPVALGLGRGALERQGGDWRFTPARADLSDGLPADAWTSLESTTTGASTWLGERSFTAGEISRILGAVLGSGETLPGAR